MARPCTMLTNRCATTIPVAYLADRFTRFKGLLRYRLKYSQVEAHCAKLLVQAPQ